MILQFFKCGLRRELRISFCLQVLLCLKTGSSRPLRTPTYDGQYSWVIIHFQLAVAWRFSFTYQLERLRELVSYKKFPWTSRLPYLVVASSNSACLVVIIFSLRTSNPVTLVSPFYCTYRPYFYSGYRFEFLLISMLSFNAILIFASIVPFLFFLPLSLLLTKLKN